MVSDSSYDRRLGTLSGTWKEWEGQVVNGIFPLHRLLGSGETAAVFLTQRGEAEPRNAALKLVLAGPENADFELSRWQRAAQLSHPHLIRLFDSGVCEPSGEGLVYAVMEYGEENLADIIRERPLNEAEARDMLESVLSALAYIHGRGLVHGHLKTANILAVGDQVKISSDGICEVGELHCGPGISSVYHPPEFQIEGNSAAGDVWSLGVVLVEALTQRLPGAELPEGLSPVLAGIVRDCLEQDPQRRPSVAEVAARLHPASPSVVPSTAPEPPAAMPSDVSRKKRYAVILAVAAGLALAAIIGLGHMTRHQTPVVAVEQPKTPDPVPTRPVDPKPGPFQKSAATEKKESAVAAPPVPPPDPAPSVRETGASGQVLRQVLPDVPRAARDTIHGTVKISVRAHVDPSGHVTSAELEPPLASKYLSRFTLEAARQWEFQPAKSQSEWILRFDLTRTGTTVHQAAVSR